MQKPDLLEEAFDPKPVTMLAPVELVVYNEHTGETIRLPSSGYELEVVFDIFKGNLRLKEIVRDKKVWSEILRKEVVFLNESNSSFLNLEGLSDDSILLSFRPESLFKDQFTKRMRLCHQSKDFNVDIIDNPLFNAFLGCASENQIFYLRFPKDRHKDWKTIGLVLLTYRRITAKMWHRMINCKTLPGIAGFDWESLCQSAES